MPFGPVTLHEAQIKRSISGAPTQDASPPHQEQAARAGQHTTTESTHTTKISPISLADKDAVVSSRTSSNHVHNGMHAVSHHRLQATSKKHVRDRHTELHHDFFIKALFLSLSIHFILLASAHAFVRCREQTGTFYNSFAPSHLFKDHQSMLYSLQKILFRDRCSKQQAQCQSTPPTACLHRPWDRMP